MKRKRYWLIIGIIFLAVHTLVWLYFFHTANSSHLEEIGWVWLPIAFIDFPGAFIVANIVNLFVNLDVSITGSFDEHLILFSGSIQWFAIGSMIGLAYGKFKHCNVV